MNQQNYQLQTQEDVPGPVVKGQFLSSMVKLSPKSQRNQKLSQIQKTSFRSPTKDQPSSKHQLQAILMHHNDNYSTESAKTSPQNGTVVGLKRSGGVSAKNSTQPHIIKDLSQNHIYIPLQKGSQEKDDETYEYVNQNIDKQSPDSTLMKRNRNDCLRDFSDVRRSRHNSSFPAPSGYKMPQLVHCNSKASHSIVAAKPL